MINKNKTQVAEDGGDLNFFYMNLFVCQTWAEYWISHRRSKREEFTTKFGLRKAQDKHQKKQVDNDVSEVTSGSHVLKRRSRKAKQKYANTNSKDSKATRSSMKETRHVDHDEDSPPPSSDESFDLEKSMMICLTLTIQGGGR